MTTAIQLRQQNPLVQPHRIVPATHIESLRGRNVGKVVVDELEQVLFYLLGHEVSMVTGTDEDPVNYQPNEKKENVTPIFGGLIADKIMGYRNAIILGAFLMNLTLRS
jgi:hypothetical protein